MPQGLVALLPLIFGGVSTGITAGEAIANAVSGPPQVSTPPAIPTTGPPKISPSTAIQSSDQTAADVQARGGGGLSPLFTQLLEGQGGGGGGTPYTSA
jgi:hypothetical protein